MTEKLKKKVEELKGKVAEQTKASKDPKKDMPLRKLRKQLKRAQRHLTAKTVLTLDERLARDKKLYDHIENVRATLEKETKKSEGDPIVHSLRKKVKSYKKRVGALERLVKKREKNAKAAEKPAVEEKPAEKKAEKKPAEEKPAEKKAEEKKSE